MLHAFEPCIGLSAVSTEPTLDPLSPSLSLPLPHSCSMFFLSLKINVKKVKYKKKKRKRKKQRKKERKKERERKKEKIDRLKGLKKITLENQELAPSLGDSTAGTEMTYFLQGQSLLDAGNMALGP